MATLYKHGSEIGRLEYLTYSIAVMSNGKLLRNQGDGWKLCRKVKPESTPQHCYEVRLAKLNEAKTVAPMFSEYKRLLHAEFALKSRAIAHEIIGTMPQDPDGCYSELTDHGFFHGSLDDMVALCRAYEAMELERQAASQPAMQD